MAEPELLSRDATPINGGLLQAVEEAHSGSYDGMGSSQFRNGNTYQGEFKECTMNGKGECNARAWKYCRPTHPMAFNFTISALHLPGAAHCNAPLHLISHRWLLMDWPRHHL